MNSEYKIKGKGSLSLKTCLSFAEWNYSIMCVLLNGYVKGKASHEVVICVVRNQKFSEPMQMQTQTQNLVQFFSFTPNRLTYHVVELVIHFVPRNKCLEAAKVQILVQKEFFLFAANANRSAD